MAENAYFSFYINSLHWFRGHLDMVGVVGSSPIAPTKQNPLCWAVWKGSPKGGPFFVVCDLQNFCKTPTSERQFCSHLDVLNSFLLCQGLAHVSGVE